MMAIRTDGDFFIYILQVQLASNQKWVDANLDHFGFPWSFNASADCWQVTGVHGTFHKNEAIEALKWIREHWKKEKFRLVCRQIMQRTMVVSEQW